MNIHLTIDLFTFNYMCNVLYTTITHYQNKTLYNKVFFGTIFTDLMMFSRKYRTQAMLNNAKYVV